MEKAELYSIVDLETTGGDPKKDRITEVAVYLHNGHEVLNSFTSLVNPGVRIPPLITRITGIDNEMVRDAPPFYEVAKQIVEITQNAVFVAHNARFDYSFLQREFRQLGYTFTRKQLCTVKLSQKIMPGLPSYSLKNLAAHLKIKNEARHRAYGDAFATVKLFEHLLHLQQSPSVDLILAQEVLATKLPPNLNQDIVTSLPEETGVYYFLDRDHKVLYVGKSNNIRKRILSHFQGAHNSVRTMRMLERIHDINYVLTGSELVALLLENEEIKRLQTPFNRAQRRQTFRFGIYAEPDSQGYLRLWVDKIKKDQKPVSAFAVRAQAESALNYRSRKNQLCPKLCNLETGKGRCFHHQLHICLGACVGEEGPNSYNERVQLTISQLNYGRSDQNNFLIIGDGRHYQERSVVYVENGIYQGYDYLDTDALKDLEAVRMAIPRKAETPDVQRIIQGYIKKNRKEVFHLNERL